jgi:hypothetical protein
MARWYGVRLECPGRVGSGPLRLDGAWHPRQQPKTPRRRLQLPPHAPCVPPFGRQTKPPPSLPPSFSSQKAPKLHPQVFLLEIALPDSLLVDTSTPASSSNLRLLLPGPFSKHRRFSTTHSLRLAASSVAYQDPFALPAPPSPGSNVTKGITAQSYHCCFNSTDCAPKDSF